MKKTLAISFILSFLCLPAIFSVTSCSTIQEQNTEDSLRNAVDRYWGMRMEGNYEGAYKMEYKQEGLPPYDIYKSKASLIKKKMLKIKFMGIKDVRITEGEIYIVDIVFEYSVPEISKPYNEVLSDKWLYKDQKWWHIFPL